MCSVWCVWKINSQVLEFCAEVLDLLKALLVRHYFPSNRRFQGLKALTFPFWQTAFWLPSRTEHGGDFWKWLGWSIHSSQALWAYPGKSWAHLFWYMALIPNCPMPSYSCHSNPFEATGTEKRAGYQLPFVSNFLLKVTGPVLLSSILGSCWREYWPDNTVESVHQLCLTLRQGSDRFLRNKQDVGFFFFQFK